MRNHTFLCAVLSHGHVQVPRLLLIHHDNALLRWRFGCLLLDNFFLVGLLTHCEAHAVCQDLCLDDAVLIELEKPPNAMTDTAKFGSRLGEQWLQKIAIAARLVANVLAVIA